MTPRTASAFVLTAIAGSHASAQIVAFDGQSEGFAGFEYTENGIVIRDFDPRIPGSPPPGSLNIDDASQTLAPFAPTSFSSPNAMSFLGYSPGPQCGFSRIGSLRIIPPDPRTAASIDVFQFNFDPGNTIVFAAFVNGKEVRRTTVPVGGSQVLHHRMSLECVGFDELRLFGEGPNDQGVFFGVIDNIIVGEVDFYVNCDGSSLSPILNVNDFICFQQRFAAGDPYANCDGSTMPPVLNVNDFICFQQQFAASVGMCN